MAALRRLGFAGSDAQVIQQAAKKRCRCWLPVARPPACGWPMPRHSQPERRHGRWPRAFHRRQPELQTHPQHRTSDHQSSAGGDVRQPAHFAAHAALPAVAQFGDEGAANHTRFCRACGEAGVEFFVFGRSAFDTRYPAPQKYPARQTLEASQAVARLHGLREEGVVYAQQIPSVIDQGVFHNDVIAVGNGEVLFHRGRVSRDRQDAGRIERQTRQGRWEISIGVRARSAVTVDDAVRSCLFSSQLPVTSRRFDAVDRAGRMP